MYYSLLLQTTNKKSDQIAAITMTLSDLQRNLPIASPFKCNFSYSCAAVYKISTVIARRAVSLR